MHFINTHLFDTHKYVIMMRICVIYVYCTYREYLHKYFNEQNI